MEFPTQVSCDVIVLQLRNYGESDRIVEFLTAEHGRINALARGARASRRRFAGGLDRFASLHVQLRIRPGLWHLEAADVLSLRLGLRDQWDRLQRAHRLSEVARVLTPEGQASALYGLLGHGLDSLDAGQLPLAMHSLVAMVAAAGFMPDLEVCAGCGQRAETVAISPVDGALCRRCAEPGRAQPDVMAVLRGAECQDGGLADRVERLIAELVAAHTGKALKTF